MSNARQTIQAAHDANASLYAPDHLKQAEEFMDQATQALENGDYLSAKDFAVSAQQHAIKARQKALIMHKNSN